MCKDFNIPKVGSPMLWWILWCMWFLLGTGTDLFVWGTHLGILLWFVGLGVFGCLYAGSWQERANILPVGLILLLMLGGLLLSTIWYTGFIPKGGVLYDQLLFLTPFTAVAFMVVVYGYRVVIALSRN